jgi:hypothetical protein
VGEVLEIPEKIDQPFFSLAGTLVPLERHGCAVCPHPVRLRHVVSRPTIGIEGS